MFSLFLPSGDFSTINEDLINNIKIFCLKNIQFRLVRFAYLLLQGVTSLGGVVP